jgi:hypothetical protein
MPEDFGLNEFLKNTYGTSIDGRPIFRLLWTTGVTEKRRSHFIDMSDDIFIRDVIEVREVLKYPFAQERWVLERIIPIPFEVKTELMTDDNWSYEEVYIFQTKAGEYLPLSPMMVEAALYLFFKFYLAMTPKERADMRTTMLAKRDLIKRNKTRDILGEGRSPFGFVLE